MAKSVEFDEESIAAKLRAAADRCTIDPARPFDKMIGKLDRCLSEFLLFAADNLDEADRQTIKHHADDLIGVGNAALKKLQESR